MLIVIKICVFYYTSKSFKKNQIIFFYLVFYYYICMQTEKSNKILSDLAIELAIDPEDIKLHDIIKLQLGVDNLWYKVQEDENLKMGLFIFSDKQIPVKLRFALDKISNTHNSKLNVINVVTFTLLMAHNQAGGNITTTHQFIDSLLTRMKIYSEPKDQHVGGFFGNHDFNVIETVMKTISNYKR